LIISIWLPESPRWLIHKDRREEAIHVLAKHHAGGDMKSPLVLFEIAEISAAIKAEEAQNQTKYAAFFKSPGNRHRLFVIIVLGIMQQASGNTLISYYLALILKQIGITSPTAQNGINGGLQIFNYIAALSGATLVDRLGRRTLILGGLIGMFISYLLCRSSQEWHSRVGNANWLLQGLFFLHSTSSKGTSTTAWVLVWSF
jgi:hypothetical protein